MSTALAFDPVRRPAPFAARPEPVAPAPAPAPASAAPVAMPGTAAVARPRIVFAAALVGAVACVVAGQLALSIGTADGAYRLAALQQRSTALARQQQAEEETLRTLAAPQRLADRAAAIGMVPDDSPAYLDVRTGRVLGSTARSAGEAATPGDIVH